MTFHIIDRKKDQQHKYGKTRSQHEENLRKEWGYTMTDEQLDKCKYMEKRYREIDGCKKNCLGGHIIDCADDLPVDLSKDGWNRGKGEESLYARNYDKIKWDK